MGTWPRFAGPWQLGNNMKRLLTALGLAFLLPACDRGGRLLTTEPNVSEVTRRYAWTYSRFGSGVDSEILSKAKDAYIDLTTNGNVIFHKVPIVPKSSNGAFTIEEFRSGSGTFEIAPLGSTTKNNFYGLYLSVGKLPEPMGHPRFRRKGQSVVLSFEYFDGEFTQRMVFTRGK
jgi:hypothetical protein